MTALKGWPELDNIGKKKQQIPEYFQKYHDFLHTAATPIVGEIYCSVDRVQKGLGVNRYMMVMDVKKGNPNKMGIPRDCGYMSPNGKTYEIDWIDRNATIELLLVSFLDMTDNCIKQIAMDSAMFNLTFSKVSED